MELYVRHTLKPVHFNRTDVLENAIRRYRVASRDTGGHK
jgi:hypothetical protein